MECLICQDSGSEPLQDNIACSCKYKRHASCWIDYVHSKNELHCPMCRKDISTKSKKRFIPQVRPVRVPPYIPILEPIREERSRQTSYEELRDSDRTLSSSYQNNVSIPVNTVHNIRVEQETSSQNKKETFQQKMCKAVLCVVIAGIIIVLAVMLL